jgi:ADP-ribose pyrophosphatase YjhB (NUDIX family)
MPDQPEPVCLHVRVAALHHAPEGWRVLYLPDDRGADTWRLPGGPVDAGATIREAAVLQLARQVGVFVTTDRLIDVGCLDRVRRDKPRLITAAFLLELQVVVETPGGVAAWRPTTARLRVPVTDGSVVGAAAARAHQLTVVRLARHTHPTREVRTA